jgi:hypothetical protein
MHNNNSIGMSGSIVQKRISLLLPVWCALIALTGCYRNLVQAGKGGINIEAGDWIGQSSDGSFSMEFRIANDGENIFVVFFQYPCGQQTSYVLPPYPIKNGLSNSAFRITTSDHSSLLPKLFIIGSFIDSIHAEGTWEFAGYSDSIVGIGCPKSAGSWKGSPTYLMKDY